MQNEETAHVVLEKDEVEASKIVARIEDVRVLIDSGDADAAMALCEDILRTPGIPINTAVKVGLLVKELGHREIAASIFENAYTKLQSVIDRLEDPERALLPAAETLADLGHFDEAEALCRKAIQSAPENLTVAVGYAAFLVHRDRIDEALSVFEQHSDLTNSKFNSAIHFALVFDHLQSDDAARACLEQAKMYCKTKTQRAKLDFFLASKGMKKNAEDQHGMAVELFDGFAKTTTNSWPNSTITDPAWFSQLLKSWAFLKRRPGASWMQVAAPVCVPGSYDPTPKNFSASICRSKCWKYPAIKEAMTFLPVPIYPKSSPIPKANST